MKVGRRGGDSGSGEDMDGEGRRERERGEGRREEGGREEGGREEGGKVAEEMRNDYARSRTTNIGWRHFFNTTATPVAYMVGTMHASFRHTWSFKPSKDPPML